MAFLNFSKIVLKYPPYFIRMSCLNLNIFVLKSRYIYNFKTIFLTVKQPNTVDIKGLHGLSCASAGGKGRIARHDRANDLIQRALASANYHCILEPTGLLRDKRRPDGFSLYPYTEGKINFSMGFTHAGNTLADSYKNILQWK